MVILSQDSSGKIDFNFVSKISSGFVHNCLGLRLKLKVQVSLGKCLLMAVRATVSSCSECLQSESAEEAAMGWAPGPRITEADKTGDVKSLRRRLEDRVVLLVKGQGD